MIKQFSKADTGHLPDFHSLSVPIEQGLWVLLVAKEANIAKSLSVEEIVTIIREIHEESVNPRAMTNAFNRARNMVHVYKNAKPVRYEIMTPGKTYLASRGKSEITEFLYFEPGKRHTSKKYLSEKILEHLKGDFKIVDPYCGERTLDILGRHEQNIKFITRLNNLTASNRSKLVREITDFKTEHPNVEFRDYVSSDIHDRYILSDDALVILGSSMKDLGNKESMAVVLTKQSNQNMVDAMIENFNRRWKASTII